MPKKITNSQTNSTDTNEDNPCDASKNDSAEAINDLKKLILGKEKKMSNLKLLSRTILMVSLTR